jgi:hypothetical protein
MNTKNKIKLIDDNTDELKRYRINYKALILSNL